jgi:hypothetical protein
MAAQSVGALLCLASGVFAYIPTQTLPIGWDFLHGSIASPVLPFEQATEKNADRLMNAIGLVPLRQFHSEEMRDHMLSTPHYAHDPQFGLPVDSSRFDFLRVEGACLRTRQDGTTPLHFYFNATSRDSVLATKKLGTDLTYSGYEKVRTECYVWKRKGKNRIPLEVFYNAEREDHMTVASAEAKTLAIGNGYLKIGRVQGYVASNFGAASPVGDIAKEMLLKNETAQLSGKLATNEMKLANSPAKDLLMTLDSLLAKLIKTKEDD